MNPEPLVRRYKIADAYMIQFAKVLRLFFIEDQAQFETEDSNFATPFETDWLNTITDAEAQPTDEQRRDQLEQLTVTVKAEMTNCRNTFQAAKRYIQKAFPNNTEVWNEFGFDDYDTIRDSQPTMIEFMKRFHTTAVKYSAQLSAPTVNFSAARIAEIETRRAALDAANNAQESFNGSLPTFTRKRIAAHNAVWNICTDVCGVGKALFRNDHARYQLYLLPPSEEPSGTLALSGTITRMPDTSTPEGTPVVGAQTELMPHGLQSESDSNGMFGYANPPAGPATLRITHPLYMEQNIPVTIDPANPLVVNVVMMPLGPPPPPMP